MKINRLYINNYKSLVDFELNEPNAFSVFVGPNAAGKSNVFEALEFLSYGDALNVSDLFGGVSSYFNRNYANSSNTFLKEIKIEIKTSYFIINKFLHFRKEQENLILTSQGYSNNELFSKNHKSIKETLQQTFSRIFIKNNGLVKIISKSSTRLALDASNLEKVLKRILQNETIQEEFLEWLQIFIPEFENITVHSDNISGIDTLLIKEKYTDQPFDKSLISDGTYNILALLTAVYQSEEPQFLCIEEPENGLNPYVVRELVGFFRQICEEKGHIIWLNTHSQTLVRELRPEEIILIEKKEGITKAKQMKDFDPHGLTMDEAWLSNALGGGVPW